MRAINNGIPLGASQLSLDTKDVAFLLGYQYLHDAGIHEFRGISDEQYHLEYDSYNAFITYDQLFSQWMEKDAAAVEEFPWKLHDGAGGEYVPSFNNLPTPMRGLLMELHEHSSTSHAEIVHLDSSENYQEAA